jgi:hypothetical protein
LLPVPTEDEWSLSPSTVAAAAGTARATVASVAKRKRFIAVLYSCSLCTTVFGPPDGQFAQIERSADDELGVTEDLRFDA